MVNNIIKVFNLMKPLESHTCVMFAHTVRILAVINYWICSTKLMKSGNIRQSCTLDIISLIVTRHCIFSLAA